MSKFRRLSSTNAVKFAALYPSAVCGDNLRPALVATTISSLRSRFNRAISLSLRPIPYTSAVSMKFTPQSTALCSAAMDSPSSTAPHDPPIAHAPKLTAETFHPVRPNARYCMFSLQAPLQFVHHVAHAFIRIATAFVFDREHPLEPRLLRRRHAPREIELGL